MKHKSILSAILLTVILSLAVIPPASSQPVAPENPVLAEVEEPLVKHAYATDHVLVQLQPGAELASNTEGSNLNALYADLGVRGTQAVFPADHALQVMRLNLAPNSDIEASVARLEQNPNILWAEPDYLAYAADTTPDDPEFASQWGLTQIDAPAAWDVVTGTQGTVIAVLDSGMDLTHEDLAAKLWVNPGEVAGNGIDDDNNGFIDDINGWNFVSDNNDPSDDHGHGTQVAGIAAAVTDNATGIAGVCWNCRIMPVKVMQVSGAANYSDIAAGVIYAAKKGADVINLSLGGYYDSTTLTNAIQSAVNDYGAIIIAGAGNDNKSSKFYPAAYDEVLAVAGTDSSDVKVGSSNYGSWIDVSAPGENITAPFLGGGYGPVNGTSYATPFASGLAGLIHSQNPTWSPELIQAQIVKTSEEIDSVNPSYAGQLGSGRINANLAVTTAPHPILTLDSTAVDGDLSGRPTAGIESDLEVTITNDWLDATNVQGVLSSTDPLVTIATNTADFGSVDAGAIATNSPVYQFTVDTSAGYNYDIAFDLALSANSGAYTVNIPITITTRSANEPVAGTISTDTTWTNDKTYIVTNNVGVAPGVTLTIEAGTTVLFDGLYSLNVGGTLIARGTETAPIIFDANEGVSEWERIEFYDTSPGAIVTADNSYIGGSVLEWVEIDRAENGITTNTTSPYLNYLTLHTGQLQMTPNDIVRAGSIVSNTQLLMNSDISVNTRVEGGVAEILNNKFWDGLQIESGKVLSNTLRNKGVYQIDNYSPNSMLWILGNNIEDVIGWAIIVNNGYIPSHQALIAKNRIVGNLSGIRIRNSEPITISQNLIADTVHSGMLIYSNANIISNTFTGNYTTSVQIGDNKVFGQLDELVIRNNNFEGNLGNYDIENYTEKTDLPFVDAQNNWWGTADSVEIGQRIYDYMDGDFTLGQVIYTPTASTPITDAPAYVRGVTITPDSVIGIETATFEVEFSKNMRIDTAVSMLFHSGNRGNVVFIPIADLSEPLIWDIAVDSHDNVWVATFGNGLYRYDGSAWTQFKTENSGIANDYVTTLSIDNDDNIWCAGGNEAGISRYNGTQWTTYDFNNTPLKSLSVHNKDWSVNTENGSVWFITVDQDTDEFAVNRFFEGQWQVFDYTNTILPKNYLVGITVDSAGDIWVSSKGALYRYDGTTWQSYVSSEVGLPDFDYYNLVIDNHDVKWFVDTGEVYNLTESGTYVNHQLHNIGVETIVLDDNNRKWVAGYSETVYVTDDRQWYEYSYPEFSIDGTRVIKEIAFTNDGARWFGVTYSGLYKQIWGFEYPINETSTWLNDSSYQTSYDFNALIPRDTYSLTVQGAVGIDGMEIAPYNNFTFTVDYAGAIADITAPSQPEVFACGASNISTLSAYWEAIEEDGTIDSYHYAIGTTPEGINVVDWTPTTATSFNKTNLNLVTGQTYYVSVQARNTGGLWSEVGTSTGVVAGSGTCPGATFSATPLSGYAPLSVTFTDTSTGDVSSWLWDFGDTLTSTVQNPTHQYVDTGIYTVTLTIAGPEGSNRLTKVDYINVGDVEEHIVFMPMSLKNN